MTLPNNPNKLPLKFYQRNVHTVAKELLGKVFVRKINDRFISGRIVEVEAYDGNVDQAAHSYNGKTKRNEVMFDGGGVLYVYFTYGMHFCANVVTGKLNSRTALLIRAIEPIDGIEVMSVNRYGKKNISQKEKINLTNGPGKICLAFGIQRKENGTSLMGDEIFILDAKKISKSLTAVSTRIGIKKSVDLPWRYYIKNNQFVSKK
ncbi:MAG: DNA-3-methyladenine glycosylase [Bacteroidota bacterium]